MPPLHRYLGTPVTTWILNTIFSSHFSDIHCGMRGITKDALVRMDLRSQSWEYASEMVLKSVHMRLVTEEVPIRFLKDREGRLSHHKRSGWFSPWHAAWINLRAMFVYGANFFLFKPGLAALRAGLPPDVPAVVRSRHHRADHLFPALDAARHVARAARTTMRLHGHPFAGVLRLLGATARRWFRRFSYTRSVTVSAVLFAIGLVFTGLLTKTYLENGFAASRGHANNLGFTGLLLDDHGLHDVHVHADSPLHGRGGSQTVSTDDWNRHWTAYAESAAQNPSTGLSAPPDFRALDLARAQKPARLLEIGCGQGDLSRELKERHPEIELVGMDLSEAGVEIARAKVSDSAFFQQDLMRPMALPERYRQWATHAVCSEVLEHLDDPRAALENARSCLAPGGRLVVTVPAGPMSAFDHHIGHRRHFTPERLRKVLEGAGLEVSALHGAGFPFFNLYRLTVVARGRKLITDVDAEHPLPASARAAMRVFSKLFGLNAHEGSRGWQLVAIAVEPTSASARATSRR